MISGPSIHAEFARRAEERPDAIAIVDGDRRLSYRWLDRRANAVARELVRLGTAPEDRVAVLATRSAEAIVAMLGVLRADAAYLPLDPQHPRERLRLVVADSGARLVVTDAAEALQARALTGGGTGLLEIHCTEGLEATGPAVTGEAATNAAYVMYTSGSTGAPKGVVVEHRNVLALLDATRPHFAFTQDDVWTLFASLAFDYSVWEIWGALLTGGRLVIVPEDARRSPGDFRALTVREGATIVSLTPATLRQLSRWEEQNHPGDPFPARWLVSAGESLTPGMLEAWFARHGDQAPAIANVYGITETTVFTTFRRIVAGDLAEPGTSLIGRPLVGCTAQIEPEPGSEGGETGELLVGGAGVARGYLNRPALTQERFLPDPATPGGRLYRSGDRVRRRTDGELEYLGRLDHQVKLRGYRIELGEVEAALRGHPGVHEAVVVLDAQGATEPRLVAYLTAPPSVSGRPPSVPELREYLSRMLPEYMVPGVYAWLPAIPLTPNGKADRARLPAAHDQEPASVAFVAPTTPLQQGLARIWAEVLGTDEVGLDDDFFDLGGHSMLAIRIVALARDQLGLDLRLRSVFEASTVRRLAELPGAVSTGASAPGERPGAAVGAIGPAGEG